MRPIPAVRLRAHSPLLILALVILPGLAKAADPLEDFRQVLSQFPNFEDKQQAKAHQKLLEKTAAALVRPSDLRRALFLQEWHGNGEFLQQAPGEEENPLGKIHQTIRRDLAERLKASLRDGLGSKEPERRLAAVTFLSSMAREEIKRFGESVPARERPQGVRSPRFTPSMAEDVRKVLAVDKDAEVRAAAADALVALDPVRKETLEALSPLLATDRAGVERRAAADGLGRIFRALTDPQSRQRLDRFGPLLVKAAGSGLGDKDAAVRRLCLETIQQAARHIVPQQQIGVVPQQQNAGRQPFSRPLAGAVNEQMAAVIGLLTDGALEVRLSAHQVLEEIAAVRRHLEVPLPPPTESELPPPGNRKPGNERRKGELPPKGGDLPLDELPGEGATLDGVLKALKKSLADDEVRVRLAALYVLETLGDAAAPVVEEVAKVLKDKNGFVRWGAARALHNMAPQGADKAVPALIGALKDDNKTVRLTVVSALRRYGPKAAEAVEPLGVVVGDAEPQVRLGAINALAAIGEKARSQSGVLVRALKDDKTPEVRAAAARALSRLGALGREALKALRFALRDPDAAVRQAAGDALLDNPGS